MFIMTVTLVEYLLEQNYENENFASSHLHKLYLGQLPNTTSEDNNEEKYKLG